MAPIKKTPKKSMTFDLKSQIPSENQLFKLSWMIFGCEVSLGGHFSRKVALISGSDEPLSYGRMEMSRSAVSASTPKKRWQATLAAPRTRTNRPPQLSYCETNFFFAWIFSCAIREKLALRVTNVP